MIKKSFIPESFNFGMPSVEIIGATQKGLDKTAMVKRASAFDDVLEHLTKRANRTYLHVITTGAFEKYGPNANCFIAGTPVVTDKGFVPIEKVQVGDNVMTHSGKFEPVIRSISRSYNGQLVTVYAKGMKPVTMTYNHPVFTVYDEAIQDGIYRAASYIHKDTKLLSYVAKTKTFKVIPVSNTKVAQPNPSVTVYNLEVLHDHSYCVPYVVHNCDAWNGDKLDMEIPYPEKGVSKVASFDGGLSMYHDDTYMKNGAVYQEHKTASAGEKPSGEVLAARYNKPMARGELIIAVDNEKWASRLDRKAKGNDIYLSIGARVPYDTCIICGRKAKTAGEHCEHFKKHRGELFDDGSISCVMNDKPDFYDISGVDVPADRIAFVLKKVQPKESEDGETKTASLHEAYDMAANMVATRRAMPMTKAAFILSKLAEMEKRIDGIVEGDKKKLDFYKDDDEPEEDFITAVENFPSDEIVSTANRKGILLTPKMLFRILGKEIPESALNECEDDCCGDLSCMMRELQEDEDSYDDLVDGSFDQRLPVDLNLDRILEKFMPFFGMSDPAVNTRIIQITIRGVPAKKQKKEASFNKTAQEALRRTYARYLISFASQNSDHVVMNAMMKAATIGK